MRFHAPFPILCFVHTSGCTRTTAVRCTLERRRKVDGIEACTLCTPSERQERPAPTWLTRVRSDRPMMWHCGSGVRLAPWQWGSGRELRRSRSSFRRMHSHSLAPTRVAPSVQHDFQVPAPPSRLSWRAS